MLMQRKRITIITLTFSLFLFLSSKVYQFLGPVSDYEPVKGGAGNPATDMYSNDYRGKTLYLSKAIQTNIKKNCEKLGISTEWDFYKTAPPLELMAQESTHIVVAFIAKSGSSSFKRFLYLTEGDILIHVNIHLEDPHWKQVKRYDRVFESEVDLASFVKIVTMRNPIVRLVSAFRDKQLSRFEVFSKEEIEGLSDTEVFVRFIEKLFVQRGFNNKINTDTHFRPQWEMQEICTFPYDILMPMEHPEHSIKLLQELTNTTHIPFPRVNRSLHGSTLDFARKYFNSLSSIQLKAVMMHYKRDFEVLGYTRLHEKGFPELSMCVGSNIEQSCW